MCGLAGIFGADPDLIHAMMDTMEDRGPDGRDFVKGEGYTIGHTRLALVGGMEVSQPFTSGKLVWAVNGEIYNWRELREELPHVDWTTDCDSEVVGHLIMEFGIRDALNMMNGEFAIIVHDGWTKTTHLIRDRFGIKPLFYHVRDGAMVAASTCKALSAAGVLLQQSDVELAHQLAHFMMPGQSPYRGINTVPPGSVVSFWPGGSTYVRSWWDCRDFLLKQRNVPFSAAAEETRKLMREAVIARRFQGEEKPALYLSGGLDSRILHWCSPDITPISVVWEGDTCYDEREHLPANGHRILATKQKLLDGWLRLVRVSERTVYNALGVAKLMLSREARELGFRCVISGQGADELFCGYPFLREAQFKHDDDFKGNLLPVGNHEVRAWNGVGGLPSWVQNWMEIHEALKTFSLYDPFEALLELQVENYEMGLRGPALSQALWIQTMFPSQHLWWGGDRPEMANSIEGRVPFLDKHLAEFALSLNSDLHQSSSVDKPLLREAFPEVDAPGKRAFMSPPIFAPGGSAREDLIASVSNSLNILRS